MKLLQSRSKRGVELMTNEWTDEAKFMQRSKRQTRKNFESNKTARKKRQGTTGLLGHENFEGLGYEPDVQAVDVVREVVGDAVAPGAVTSVWPL